MTNLPDLAALLVVLAVGCSHPAGPAAHGGPASASQEPDCSGPVLAWTPSARHDALAVIELSLPRDDVANDLALATAAVADWRAASPLTYLIVPDGVATPDIEGVIHVASIPARNDQREVRYWRIEVGELYGGGATFVREQGTIFPDGRVSRAVSIVCGVLVDGSPVVVWETGSAN